MECVQRSICTILDELLILYLICSWHIFVSCIYYWLGVALKSSMWPFNGLAAVEFRRGPRWAR